MGSERRNGQDRTASRLTPPGYLSPNEVAILLRTSMSTLIKVAQRLEAESLRPLEMNGKYIAESELGRLNNGLEAYPHYRTVRTNHKKPA